MKPHCDNNTHIPLADAVTLPMVFSFFMGAEEMPPLGFPHKPILVFSDTDPYPTSTCAIQITFPTKLDNYMYADLKPSCHMLCLTIVVLVCCAMLRISV